MSAVVDHPPPARASVVVYTRSGCGYCVSARSLLQRRGIAFEEWSLDDRADFRGELRRISGRSTVPQILIGGRPVGGASDLARLDRRGVLVPLVEGRCFPHATTVRRLRPAGLLAALLAGRRGGLWRHEAVLLDEDGRTLARVPASSAVEAEALAAAHARGEPSALARALTAGRAADG